VVHSSTAVLRFGARITAQGLWQLCSTTLPTVVLLQPLVVSAAIVGTSCPAADQLNCLHLPLCACCLAPALPPHHSSPNAQDT
jgi:hypothetical protein